MKTATIPAFPAPNSNASGPRRPTVDKLLLSADEGAALIGVSVRSFHMLRNRPGFPAPVVLGPRYVRWKANDIRAWVEALATSAEKSPEPAQLARPEARQKRREKLAARHAAGVQRGSARGAGYPPTTIRKDSSGVGRSEAPPNAEFELGAGSK